MNTDITSTSRTPGIIASVVVALLPCYWIGIGGSLVASAAGIVATIVVCNLLQKSADEARHADEGSAQLVGVLDSSQLGNDYEMLDKAQDQLDRASRARKIVIAAALAAALVGAGGVQLATSGRGIHFYLGSWSLPSLFGDAEKSKPKKTEEQDSANNEQSSQSNTTPSSSSSQSETTPQQPSSEEPAQQPSTPNEESTQPQPEEQTTPQEQPTPSTEPATSEETPASSGEQPAQSQPTQPEATQPAEPAA